MQVKCYKCGDVREGVENEKCGKYIGQGLATVYENTAKTVVVDCKCMGMMVPEKFHVNRNFGPKLSEIRKRVGVSMGQLSKETGIPLVVISGLESGYTRPPSENVFMRLVGALGHEPELYDAWVERDKDGYCPECFAVYSMLMNEQFCARCAEPTCPHCKGRMTNEHLLHGNDSEEVISSVLGRQTQTIYSKITTRSVSWMCMSRECRGRAPFSLIFCVPCRTWLPEEHPCKGIKESGA